MKMRITKNFLIKENIEIKDLIFDLYSDSEKTSEKAKNNILNILHNDYDPKLYDSILNQIYDSINKIISNEYKRKKISPSVVTKIMNFFKILNNRYTRTQITESYSELESYIQKNFRDENKIENFFNKILEILEFLKV